LGISFIETPSVDINRMIRKDKFIFEPTEQIGLKTFNNWNCYKAYDYSAECYDFISKGIIEQDNGLGCKKVLIATGPFNMLPGDEARIVVGLVFAAPAKGGEPDGTFEDLTGLKRSVDKNGNPQMLASIGSLISNLNMARETYYPELASKVNDSHSSSENMLSISPNPVSNSANLRFNLKDAGLTKISIVNQFGQEINVIYNNWLDAGEHNINLSFEKNTYSDGIYFIRLTSGNSTQTKKFAIVR